MRFVAGALVAVLALLGVAASAGADATSTGYVLEVHADPYEWTSSEFTATVTGGGRTASTTASLGSGTYEIRTSAEPGTYHVALSGDGLDTTTAEFEVSAVAVTRVPVVIHHTAQVRGRVVDDSGRPLRGAWLTLRSSTTLRVADYPYTLDDGTFEVHGVDPGTYDLENDADQGYAPITRSVRVTDDGVVELGDVVFSAGTVVTGRVLDAGGKPVAGAAVGVTQAAPTSGQPGRTWHNSARSDRAGRVRVTGMVPGSLRVEASADGYLVAARTVTANSSSASVGDIRLTAAAAIAVYPELPGEVRPGDPRATARADLFAVVGGVRSAQPVATSSQQFTAKDRHPSPYFRDLAAGRYVVRLTGSWGSLPSAVVERTVVLRTGAHEHVDATLSFGRPITGRAYQPDGSYGPGMNLTAYDVPCAGPLPEPGFAWGWNTTTAGRNGVFSLPSLPGHCYDLRDPGNIYASPYVTSPGRVRAGSSGVRVQQPISTTLSVDRSTRAYGVRSIDVKVRAVHQVHGSTPVVDDGIVEVFAGKRSIGHAEVSRGLARVKFATPLRPGARELEIRYSRATGFEESVDFAEVRVAKARAKVSVDVTKVRRGHASTVTVVVRSPLAVTGRVDVYVDGSKVDSARVHQVHGKALVRVKLPKTTTKGTSIKVTATYRGSATVAAATRSVRLGVG